MNLEMEVALVTFAAVVAAQLGKAALRMLRSWVKRTPTSIDDKVLAAVETALGRVHVVRVVDKKASRDPTDYAQVFGKGPDGAG